MNQPAAGITAQLPVRSPGAILILAVTATALASFEVGLVAVALPALAASFAVSPATIQWVVIAYQLAIMSALIPAGWSISPVDAECTLSGRQSLPSRQRWRH